MSALKWVGKSDQSLEKDGVAIAQVVAKDEKVFSYRMTIGRVSTAELSLRRKWWAIVESKNMKSGPFDTRSAARDRAEKLCGVTS